MVDFPSATTTVSDKAAATARGLDTCCVIAPVFKNADITPRTFTAPDALFAQHDYSEGLEYAALHFDGNGKPILFIGVPITTIGTVSRVNNIASGTSIAVLSVAATANGVMTDHHGIVTVLQGGVVGTDQIILGLSLDGGFKTVPVRLGTGTSYTDPYAGFQITVAAGTLVTGETVLTWKGTGPRCQVSDVTAAFNALGEGQDAFRTAVLIGDVQNSTEAQTVLDAANAYETSKGRFTLIRCGVPDRQPLASMSKIVARMTGSPTLTFAEIGATGDTITRSAGSWLTDGFAPGDTLTITGTASNNISGTIASLTDLVITLGALDVNPEVVSGAVVIASPTITFNSVGHTIVRNRGSWLTDGFRTNDVVTISGSVSNNATTTAALSVTATTLTFASGMTAETAASSALTITTGQTEAAWGAATVAAFETITGPSASRISLGMGRGRKASPFSGWNYRRNANWFASVREYQHDIHIAPWRKNDGNLGVNLKGLDGKRAEWDDRVSGNVATTNRFTSLRTWGNGPTGAYVAISSTRAEDSSLRVMTHNMNVANLVQTLTQQATEDALIGVSLDLNDDGTASEADRAVIEGRVNASYDLDVLANKQNEGKRASSCHWTMNATDILNVPGATVTGVCVLNLNGTVLKVNTTVRIKSGGQ